LKNTISVYLWRQKNPGTLREAPHRIWRLCV